MIGIRLTDRERIGNVINLVFLYHFWRYIEVLEVFALGLFVNLVDLGLV